MHQILFSLKGSAHNNYFNRFLIALWIFSSLLLCESFKTKLRDQLISQPKYWYKTIDELANGLEENPTTQVIMHENSRTHQLMKEYATINASYERVNQSAKYMGWNEMLTVDFIIKIYQSIYIPIGASHKLAMMRFAQKELSESLALDDIKLNKSNDVRLIRRKFKYANEMSKM